MARFFKYSLLSATLLLAMVAGCGDLDTELSSLTVSPSTVTVGVNRSETFTAIARDSVDQIIPVTPTWTVTGDIGTINANGIFTANSSAGNGTVVATYQNVSDSASVTITDNAWIEGKITGENDPGGIQNILVSIRNSSFSARTDSSGDYSIGNIPPGTYDVYTEENNQIYNSLSQEVTVSTGQTKIVNFYLTLRTGIPTTPTTTFPSF
jgi:hypothetical protein